MSSTTSPTGKKIVLNTLLETDHYASLIKDLTCTKCNKYMRPPIHLCVDGHSVCGVCYEKSYQCHECKKEFSLVRPAVLESLANKVLFPCTNEGCPKHATLPILEKHAAQCQFRIINCFMSRVYGECQWEGRAGEWMDHCFMEHKQRVTELPFITVKDKWDAKRTEPVLNYFLLKCFERVFNVYQIYDKRGGRMMWTVLVNHENAEKYYFEVDLFLPSVPSKRIVYRRPCKCEKDADFLEHTQNVYIPVENVFSMLDESESVNFTVRIEHVVDGPAALGPLPPVRPAPASPASGEYENEGQTASVLKRRSSTLQILRKASLLGSRSSLKDKICNLMGLGNREVENLPLLETPSKSESRILLHNEDEKENEEKVNDENADENAQQ